MQITNVPADKEIFTAKTDDGFVGCFRLENGIFFTAEVFSKALPAANAARKLKKELGTKEALVKKSAVVKSAKAKKSKKLLKPLGLGGKLYSLDETSDMPLLSFKEVWIIKRYENEFVSDALNQEKKKLVAYSADKENALRFDCHEEAKRIMRVLKGTVGPGFNLQRFFIRVD